MKKRGLRSERGVALLQVMVMSVVLLLMAVGVMQIIFGTHFMYARVKSSEENRSWVEACLAQKNQSWKGSPCGGKSLPASDSCDFTSDKGPIVEIACVDPSNKADPVQVDYTVTWQ